jgi:hypothetical protein
MGHGPWLASCLFYLVLTFSVSHLSADIVQAEDREVVDRSSSRPLIMDLSRLTVRQQLKYLEEQAAEQEVDKLEEAQKVQVVNDDDKSIEIHIGSWTSAILPSAEKPLKVKVIMNDDKYSEEEEDVKVRLKRLRTSRRIVESDDDDDDENEMDAMEEDPKEEKEVPVKHEPEKDKKYSLFKLLGRVKQTKEKSKEVKMKKVEKETKPTKKTQLSIPKKSGIPRKSVDADKEKASSLLAEYKKTKPAAAKPPAPAAPSSEREPPKKKLRNTPDPTSQPVSPKPDLTRSPIASPKPDTTQTIQPFKTQPTAASKKSLSLCSNMGFSSCSLYAASARRQGQQVPSIFFQ